MNQYAKITDGKVENLIVSHSHPEPTEEYVDVRENRKDIQIGFSYDPNIGFTPFKGDIITLAKLHEAPLHTTEGIVRIKEKAKAWRNEELKKTDWIIMATDHPELSAYKIYRQKLRDWPNTSDFPTVIPEL